MKIFSKLALCLLVALPIQAATLHVDGTACTLADAIVAANTDTSTGGCPQGDAGEDNLVLDADLTLSAADPTSTLHGGVRAGLPDITDDLTISAGLGSVIRRDPTFTCEVATVDPVFRFLHLESGSLTLQGLTFEDGCFVGSDITNEGGGLRAAASTELTLDGVTVATHSALATSGSLEGGFLYTEGERLTLIGGRFEDIVTGSPSGLQGGVLHIVDSVVASIQTTDFVGLDLMEDISLQGGAIYSRGQLDIENSTFEDLIWVISGSLQGGAIYSSAGSLDIHHSSFRLFDGTSQSAGSTQGGAIYASNDRLTLTDTTFSDLDLFASGTCSGGALYTFENGPYERLIFERVRCQTDSSIDGTAANFLTSDVVLRDCLFRENEGRSVQLGRGGAVLGTRFELIERCTFLGNQLVPALSFVNPEMQGGGLVAGQIALMRNVTFAGNVARAGNGSGSDASSAFGGGLYLSNTSSISSFSAVTFKDNQAIGGSAGPGFLEGEGLGGGLYVSTGHTAEMIGSLLSGNTVTDGNGSTFDEDCRSDGGWTSLGYNIAEHPDTSCDFSAFGDITSIDPNLYPVGDYGCATTLPDGSCVPTAAIDQTSWAIDWSSCADAGVGEDGRGLLRRKDILGVPNLTADACDVGAFEARDRDGDGITDLPDLCPDDADPDQNDSDGDLVGDACDACEGDDASGDTDGDLVCDDLDLCAGSDDHADADADTVPDGCDLCLGDDASGDTDGDLVCDDLDLCAGSDDSVDSDGDTVPDGCDLCAGEDASGDSDGDGLCNDSDASVGDRVWLDGGNGLQDGGELGVSDVTVRLFSSLGVLLETTSTDSNGFYDFSPGPGDFYLEFDLPADMAFAPRDQGADNGVDSDVNEGTGTTSVFTLTTGQTETHLDCGFEPAVIGNRVWNDGNGDGLQQTGEDGLAHITVRLLDAEDRVVATTLTAEDGTYSFLGIATGEYRIEVVPPMGYHFSSAHVGVDDLIDSDIDPITGRGPLFSYLEASANQAWDAGLHTPSLFTDGFESGDLSAWAGNTP